jgi:hypothetical protein
MRLGDLGARVPVIDEARAAGVGASAWRSPVRTLSLVFAALLTFAVWQGVPFDRIARLGDEYTSSSSHAAARAGARTGLSSLPPAAHDVHRRRFRSRGGDG